jgi:hypothetical protein
LEPLLKARWERTAPNKLFFQSRGQTVCFGESRRKVVRVLVIPSTYGVAVAISVIALVLVVIVSMFFVSLSMSVSMTLGQCEIACE